MGEIYRAGNSLEVYFDTDRKGRQYVKVEACEVFGEWPEKGHPIKHPEIRVTVGNSTCCFSLEAFNQMMQTLQEFTQHEVYLALAMKEAVKQDAR